MTEEDYYYDEADYDVFTEQYKAWFQRKSKSSKPKVKAKAPKKTSLIDKVLKTGKRVVGIKRKASKPIARPAIARPAVQRPARQSAIRYPPRVPIPSRPPHLVRPIVPKPQATVNQAQGMDSQVVNITPTAPPLYEDTMDDFVGQPYEYTDEGYVEEDYYEPEPEDDTYDDVDEWVDDEDFRDSQGLELEQYKAWFPKVDPNKPTWIKKDAIYGPFKTKEATSDWILRQAAVGTYFPDQLSRLPSSMRLTPIGLAADYLSKKGKFWYAVNKKFKNAKATLNIVSSIPTGLAPYVSLDEAGKYAKREGKAWAFWAIIGIAIAILIGIGYFFVKRK